MSLVHQQLSTPWDSETGDPQGPFSQDAIAGHRAAMTAGAILVEILRKKEFGRREEFLDPYEVFLRTLHHALPTEFEALAQDLLSSEGQLEECNELLDQDRRARGADMEPVLDLLRDAAAIVQRIAGGE
jgi:hypothetical protein